MAWTAWMARFPTVGALAEAPVADVVRAWAGLGYNRRAINLQRAARAIVAEHDGRVPDTVEGLMALPGVGPYTARAVAAIAFGRPVGRGRHERPARARPGRRRRRRRPRRGRRCRRSPTPSCRRDGRATGRTRSWTSARCAAGRGRRCARTARPSRGAGTPPVTGRRRRSRTSPAARPRARLSQHDPLAARPDRRPRPRRGRRGLGRVRRPDRRPRPPGRSRGRVGARVGRPARGPRDARRSRGPAARLGRRSGGRRGGTLSPVPTETVPLPADDPELRSLTLDELERRWADAAARGAITGRDDDRRSTGRPRRPGSPGETLMEHAGTAVAAAAHALAVHNGREDRPVLILAGPGNNGGDGFVAARRLAAWGFAVDRRARGRRGEARHPRRRAQLEAPGRARRRHPDPRPGRARRRDPGAGDREGRASSSTRCSASGVQRPAARAGAVGRRARSAGPAPPGVPVLAVDTPTAVDLTSGDPSDPVVRADLTVTFHRPKTGLRTKMGRALAGRVLVAPIGIPPEVDRG